MASPQRKKAKKGSPTKSGTGSPKKVSPGKAAVRNAAATPPKTASIPSKTASPPKKKGGSPPKKPAKKECRPWGTLHSSILLGILGVHKDDFIFRLATMGVCKHWRECSKLVDAVVHHPQKKQSSRKMDKELFALGRLLENTSTISILSLSHSKDTFVAFSGMVVTPSLRVLELKSVTLCIAEIERVVALAVNLEVLVLDRIPNVPTDNYKDEHGGTYAKLRAPRLTHFRAIELVGMELDAPNLEVVHIRASYEFKAYGCHLRKLCWHLCNDMLVDKSKVEVLELDGWGWTKEKVHEIVDDMPALRYLCLKRQFDKGIHGFFDREFATKLRKLGLTTQALLPLHVLKNQRDASWEKLQQLEEIVMYMGVVCEKAFWIEHLCYLVNRCPSVKRVVFTDAEPADAHTAMDSLLQLRDSLGMTWDAQLCFRPVDVDGAACNIDNALSVSPTK